MPVPIIITEPAVGLGGGFALAYFHKRKGEQGDRPKGLSPTVSFSAGAYTSNDTWFAGGTGFRYFLAKQYGLHAGVDISRGPEIWAWNITVGSYWWR